jgi:hypothetical protein
LDGDQIVAEPLHTQGDTNTESTENTHTYKLRVGFEAIIPVFELAKTFL